MILIPHYFNGIDPPIFETKPFSPVVVDPKEMAEWLKRNRG